jgi:hypothetical protein
MTDVQLDPVEHYRMALSYLELVSQEFDKWKKIYNSHQVDRSYYDTVGASYQQHLDQAKILVDNIRAFHEARLPDAQRQLKTEQRTLKKTIRQFEAEKIPAKKMNELHRLSQITIDQLEDDIWVSGTIFHGSETKMLGGRMDMTIGEFAKRLVPESRIEDPKPLKPKGVTRRDLFMLGGTALAIAGVYFGVKYYSTLAKARFSADFSEGTRRYIRISCENRGDETLFWYIPWAEGNPRAMDIRRNPMAAVGMLVYIQQEGNDAYQLLPDSTGCWWHDDTEVAPNSRLAIRKGRIRTIVFDIDKLKELGVKPQSLKIKFTRHGGRVLEIYETPIK